MVNDFKITKKKIVGLIFILMMLFSSMISAYAYPTSLFLNIDSETQEEDNWCWAACAVCSIYYVENSAYTQEEFVETVLGEIVDEPAYMVDVHEGLEEYYVGSTYSSSSKSFITIMNNIYYQSSPMMAKFDFDGYEVGHVYLVYGYNNLGADHVYYMDPADGDFYSDSYAYFAGGSGYNYEWAETIHLMN